MLPHSTSFLFSAIITTQVVADDECAFNTSKWASCRDAHRFSACNPSRIKLSSPLGDSRWRRKRFTIQSNEEACKNGYPLCSDVGDSSGNTLVNTPLFHIFDRVESACVIVLLLLFECVCIATVELNTISSFNDSCVWIVTTDTCDQCCCFSWCIGYFTCLLSQNRIYRMTASKQCFLCFWKQKHWLWRGNFVQDLADTPAASMCIKGAACIPYLKRQVFATQGIVIHLILYQHTHDSNHFDSVTRPALLQTNQVRLTVLLFSKLNKLVFGYLSPDFFCWIM